MNSLIDIFNQVSLTDAATIAASFIAGRAATPILRHWTMAAYNYAMGGKRKLSADQVLAREAAENIVFEAIHEIEDNPKSPEYIYLETADRLFFGKKGKNNKYKIHVLNMENKNSHYLQTKMKYMHLAEAVNFIAKATDPKQDFDPKLYIPKMDQGSDSSLQEQKAMERFYRKHARMRCSKIRLKMDDPGIIEKSAKEAADSLIQMVNQGVNANRSSGNTVKLYLEGENENMPSIFFHKPFAGNLRKTIEKAVNEDRRRSVAVHFREFAPNTLLETISNARLFMRDKYIGRNTDLEYPPQEPVVA